MEGSSLACCVRMTSSVCAVLYRSDGSPLKLRLANLVIDMTVERTHLGRYYADKPVGVMVIRGENVVLMGEIVSSSLFSNYRYVCSSLR